MTNFIMVFIVAALGVSGQILFKRGMLLSGSSQISLDSIKTTFTPYLFLGLILYSVGLLFWVIIFSRVGLSFAYPWLLCSMSL
jgi:predicted membrane channel-forming protein YqfA (hemolysin III family)